MRTALAAWQAISSLTATCPRRIGRSARRRDDETQMTFRPPNFKKLPDFRSDLLAFAEEYVPRLRAFYDSRANWHRRFYRFSGITVILSGAILPVLASAHYP